MIGLAIGVTILAALLAFHIVFNSLATGVAWVVQGIAMILFFGLSVERSAASQILGWQFRQWAAVVVVGAAILLPLFFLEAFVAPSSTLLSLVFVTALIFAAFVGVGFLVGRVTFHLFGATGPVGVASALLGAVLSTFATVLLIAAVTGGLAGHAFLATVWSLYILAGMAWEYPPVVAVWLSSFILVQLKAQHLYRSAGGSGA